MENVISGAVITVLTEVAKRVQAVPITAEQKGRVRILVGALSIVSALAVAYLDGSLASSGALTVVSNTISNWIFATIAYYGLVK